MKDVRSYIYGLSINYPTQISPEHSRDTVSAPLHAIEGQLNSHVFACKCVRHYLLAAEIERIEPKYCIKFCEKLSDSLMEIIIHTIWQTFRYKAVGIAQIKERFNQLKSGLTLMELRVFWKAMNH